MLATLKRVIEIYVNYQRTYRGTMYVVTEYNETSRENK